MHYETNPFKLIWEGLKRSFEKTQNLAIMLVVAPFLLGTVNFIVQIFVEVFGAATDTRNVDQPVPVIIIGAVLLVLGIILQAAIQAFYSSFVGLAGVRTLRGQDMHAGEALSAAFEKTWAAFLVGLLVLLYALPFFVLICVVVTVNLIVGLISQDLLYISIPPSVVVTLLLIILAVRVSLRYALANYALHDGAKNATDALEKSKELTRGRLSEVFGVSSISAFVPFLSAVALSGSMGLLYGQLIAARKNRHKLPKQSPLNYVPVVVILAFLLFASLLVLLVFIAAESNK